MDDWKAHRKVAPDLSRQRQGLLNRAYSEAGKNELLEAQLSAYKHGIKFARHLELSCPLKLIATHSNLRDQLCNGRGSFAENSSPIWN